MQLLGGRPGRIPGTKPMFGLDGPIPRAKTSLSLLYDHKNSHQGEAQAAQRQQGHVGAHRLWCHRMGCTCKQGSSLAKCTDHIRKCRQSGFQLSYGHRHAKTSESIYQDGDMPLARGSPLEALAPADAAVVLKSPFCMDDMFMDVCGVS